jgi:hypothetical protein
MRSPPEHRTRQQNVHAIGTVDLCTGMCWRDKRSAGILSAGVVLREPYGPRRGGPQSRTIGP